MNHTSLPPRSAFVRHWHFLLALAVALGAFGSVCTLGTFNFFEREPFSDLYDAQATSLLHGHFDVPKDRLWPSDDPDADFNEAFIVNGRYQTYFGVGPALLRIPLLLVLPSLEGRWARAFCFAACAASATYAYALMRSLKPPSAPAGLTDRTTEFLFVVTVGIGSSTMFLASRSYTFHEANLLASAATLGCFYHLSMSLRTRSAGQMAFAGALAILGFLTRPSVGMGGPAALVTAVALGLVFTTMPRVFRAILRKPAPAAPRRFAGVRRSRLFFCSRQQKPSMSRRGHSFAGPDRRFANFQLSFASSCIAGAAVLVAAASSLAVNRARFGSAFPLTLTYYVRMNHHPERLARTKGVTLSLRNLRSNAFNYFSPDRIKLISQFPYTLPTCEPRIYPEARMEEPEPFASLTATSPALCLMFLAGAASFYAGRVGHGIALAPALVGGAAGAGLMLLFFSLTTRYLHDFHPLLVVGAAAGTAGLQRLGVIWKRLIVGVLAATCLYSVYVNWTLALYYQRVIVWGVPEERRAVYRQFVHAVRDSLHY